MSFKRRVMEILPSPQRGSALSRQGDKGLAVSLPYSVLVINSSREMANEITMQLTLTIPECSIMYAPTLDLASFLLKRRVLDLVVSSPILPDGGVERLYKMVDALESAPDIVVVGDSNLSGVSLFESNHYKFVSVRKMITASPLPVAQPSEGRKPKMAQTIRTLGADLRNDLNNPLQEIVALVFVARADSDSSASTEMALQAIEKAAQNMAHVVNDLEEKIKDAVLGDPASGTGTLG